MPVLAFTAGSLGDLLATAGLAAKVAQVLYDNKGIAQDCEALANELKSIQSTLILAEYAIQKYGSTPLGEILAHYIRPEVAQCHLYLTQFSDKVKACQQSLSRSSWSGLWQRVVWAATDETATLTQRVSHLRLKMSLMLLSLNSVGFMETGSLNVLEVQACLSNGPRSLCHIKDKTIEIVDAIGEKIPVPTVFCGTWESFHYIINGFSRDRIGQRHVERGDFEIIRPESEQVIDRSVFIRDIKEGETFEMSIILRQRKSVEDDEARCPRCSWINAARSDGIWIKCTRCSGQFYIVKVATGEEISAVHSNSSNQEDGQVDDFHGDVTTSKSQQELPEELEAKYFRRITLEERNDGSNTSDNTPNMHADELPEELETKFFRHFTLEERNDGGNTSDNTPNMHADEPPPNSSQHIFYQATRYDQRVSSLTRPWATWTPDRMPLTPPSVEPTLMVPGRESPGLFGPRTPSTGSEYDSPMNSGRQSPWPQQVVSIAEAVYAAQKELRERGELH